jgi:hypothetical protein
MLEQLMQDLASIRAGHRNSLQHVHRCAAVGQPNDQETHRLTTLMLFHNRALDCSRLHRQR